MLPGPSLRDIGCFALVARRLSFSRAAVELGLSQPAVSQAVARLERVLGLRLLVRTSREVELTEAGRTLLARAEVLLEQAAAFTVEATRLAQPANRIIRLAYAPLVGGFAASVARRLLHRKPEIEVELRAAGWSAATADLTQANVSAALMSTPFPPGFASTARFHLPITHLAVPARDPLATTTRVRLDQLLKYELLVPRTLRSSVTAGLPGPHQPRLVAIDDDLAAGLDLVAAGRGVLPVPQLLAGTIRRPDLVFVPLDAGDLRITFGLVWPPERATPEVIALVQTVQESLRSR
ncbi:LysR family hydrogen peroxide-inducible transcriptional activator [Allocatelliglobosispora scoriae]|uniref:LysR family hydrogen peroxide-inducible transcriptional activator n=1 Tax=Allocatelliglobosispora scoriae TaxID=643052 RepID=A0A841BZ28_9ACTN|nr:LysR family transcriptional regulator [Allocatelliglobosispora scoriae]MBB5872935.1 LysR family hydrogen peroxide-inducible transcriptional activator [Allocatelliglobosispora scoriae]